MKVFVSNWNKMIRIIKKTFQREKKSRGYKIKQDPLAEKQVPKDILNLSWKFCKILLNVNFARTHHELLNESIQVAIFWNIWQLPLSYNSVKFVIE